MNVAGLKEELDKFDDLAIVKIHYDCDAAEGEISDFYEDGVTLVIRVA